MTLGSCAVCRKPVVIEAATTVAAHAEDSPPDALTYFHAECWPEGTTLFVRIER